MASASEQPRTANQERLLSLIRQHIEVAGAAPSLEDRLAWPAGLEAVMSKVEHEGLQVMKRVNEFMRQLGEERHAPEKMKEIILGTKATTEKWRDDFNEYLEHQKKVCLEECDDIRSSASTFRHMVVEGKIDRKLSQVTQATKWCVNLRGAIVDILERMAVGCHRTQTPAE